MKGWYRIIVISFIILLQFNIYICGYVIRTMIHIVIH